jgi:hypothetical protein
VAELSHEAKVRLVTLLAQFCGPAEAAKIVSDEYAVTIDRRTAWKYDASKKGCSTSPRYRQLFHEVRDRWLNDMAAIPIAQQGHRLHLLDRLATKLEAQGDYGGALKAIEMAAKEVGGLFTNERRASVTANIRTVQMTAEEARAQLAARLQAYVEAQPLSA